MTIPAPAVGGTAAKKLFWIVGAAAAVGVLAIAAVVIVLVLHENNQNGIVQNTSALANPSPVIQNLEDLNGGTPEARAAALASLAEAEPQDEYRGRVTAALENLLFDGDVPGKLTADPSRGEDSEEHRRRSREFRRTLRQDLLLRTYLHWVDQKNVPAMLRMVDHPTLPDWDAKKTGLVMQALGRLQSQAAIPILVHDLASPELHEDAVAALKLIGSRARDAVVDRLFDGDPPTRHRAGEVLTSYGTTPQFIAAAAVERLKSKTPAMQINAAAWCAENAPETDEQKAVGAKLLVKLLDDLSPQVNGIALRTLKLWATKDCVTPLADFAQRQSKAPKTAETIANAAVLIEILAQFPDANAAAAIAIHLSDAKLRGEAVQALLKLGPVASDAVLQYLNDPDPEVHKEVRSLCRSLKVSDDRLFAQTFADISGTRRSRCCRALQNLAKMRPDAARRSAVGEALNAPLADPDREIANSALEAVIVWSPPENSATLMKMFVGEKREPPEAEAQAKKINAALIAIGPSVEESLIPFLKSPRDHLRREACYILREIGTFKSLKPLEEAGFQFSNSDQEFTRQTAEARKKIESRM